ncbi:hypothetical protein CCR80_05345 [Rhodothalassium salexigens]|uniref:lipoprotein-releasing ABC transporter permease subunit n=1 Tax=Rhodothalassium salexigens TaxID=1086 RepID=UPI0019113F9E|nr:lipoprotein-releasing ABC transporter permease subunit [Rhodothalassium salexigens]MBK5920465.1 hypothetical protein [Rhodothalassium salexigens]
MIRGFERTVALRYILPWNSGLSVGVIAGFSFLGIFLGVAVLIVVMSVMNGFRVELVSKIVGVNGHAIAMGFGGEMRDYQRVADDLAAVDHVERVVPFVEAQVGVTRPGGQGAFALVRGLAPGDLTKTALQPHMVTQGSLDDFGADRIVLASTIAERLGAFAGDPVTLVLPKGRATPMGVAPRLKRFTIAAVVETGLFQFDETLLVMPLDTAQTFFRRGDTVSGITLFLDDANRIDRVAPDLRAVLGGERPVGALSTWRDINSNLVSALDLERKVMFLILTLIIVIAAFNIVTSLIILVKNKSADVAILRTMGARRGAILRIFMACGALVGVTGTLLGAGAGTLFAANIQAIQRGLERLTGAQLWDAEVRYLSEIPAVVQPLEVVGVVAVAFVISLVSTLPASLWASSIDPVKVLRYQ